MQKLAFGGRTTKYQNRESPEKGRTPLITELVETCLGSLAAKGWVQHIVLSTATAGVCGGCTVHCPKG